MLRQLEYLVVLADTLHFRRAAERVNTTQSTLSAQLKALESRLGVELVERTHSRVMLTAVGTEVAEIGRRMLTDAREIRELAKRRSGQLSGVLRVGIPPTIGPSLLPRIIPKLNSEFSQLKLFVREELPASLPIGLEQGVYDVVISPLPVMNDTIVATPLFDEPLLLVLSALHPLALKKEIAWTDLKDLEVLALGPGHQCHDLVQTLCQKSGARMLFNYEGSSLDMLREMVSTGLGCTFMPGLYVQARVEHDASLIIRDIKDHRVSRTVSIAWRKSTPRVREMERLTKIIQTEIGTALAKLGCK